MTLPDNFQPMLTATTFGAEFAFEVIALPQERSPYPDIDQMLQDIPPSSEQRYLYQLAEFESLQEYMLKEVSRCMGIPERLLHLHG